MGWIAGFDHRIKLTVPAAKVGTALTHFAVKVHLSSTQGSEVFDRLGSDANRFKIAFAKADETTQMYGDIESWSDGDEEAVIWVSESAWELSSSSDTDFYMYYGTAHADNTTYISDSGGTAAQSAYDAYCSFSCNFANDPDGDAASAIKESTDGNHDLTTDGTMVTADLVDCSNGGKALDFDGTDDCALASAHSDMMLGSGDFAIEVYVNLDVYPTSGNWVTLVSSGDSSSNTFSYRLGIYNNAGNRQLKFEYSTDGTNVLDASKNLSGFYTGSWAHLGVVRDSSFLYFYCNGVDLGAGGVSGTLYDNVSDGDDFVIGAAEGGTAEFINGQIALVRIHKIYGNDDYVESEYDNNRDSFVTFGDEENEGVLLTSGFESTSTMTAIINPHAGPIDASTGFISVGALVCTIPGVIGVTVNDPRVFIFSLSAPGYEAKTFKISSFSTRIRSGDPTYLQVVIPVDDDPLSDFDIDDISNRVTNGVMVLHMGYKRDGDIILYEAVAIVDLEDIAIEEGPTKESVTLTGHRTETFNAKTVALSGASYQKTATGALRVRCTPDMYLRPGDTAQVNDESFIVDSISWSVSMATVKIRETYEIAEAA